MSPVFLNNLDLTKINGPHDAKKAPPTKKTKTNKPKRRRQNCNQLFDFTQSFPYKLYHMMQDVEYHGKEDIVCWNPDGRSFIVQDPKKFVSEILPGHFKQTKYKSFQRQLNFYGFLRITTGRLQGSYQHPCFVKGDLELCKEIKRITPPTSATSAVTKKAKHVTTKEQHSDDDEESSSSVEPVQNDADMKIEEEVKNKNVISARIDQRRDSYHFAMAILQEVANGVDVNILKGGSEQGNTATTTTSTCPPNERRDSFFNAMDTFASSILVDDALPPATTSLLRRETSSMFPDGTRLSFVGGRKFHFSKLGSKMVGRK